MVKKIILTCKIVVLFGITHLVSGKFNSQDNTTKCHDICNKMLSHGIDIYSSIVISIYSIHLCVFLPHFDHPRHPKRPDPISSLEPSQTRRRSCRHSLTPRIQRKVTLVHSTRQWCNVVCRNLSTTFPFNLEKVRSETIFIKETF